MGVIIKNSVKATIINFIGAALGMISLLIIQTSFLTPEQVGILRLITDKAILLLPFILLGIHSSSSRYYFHFENDKKLYGSFMTFILGTPLIMFALGCILFYYINLSFQVNHIILISIILFANIYIYIFESYLSTKAKILFPSFLRSIYTRIVNISLVLIYHFNILNFHQLIIGFTTVYCLYFILLAIYFKRHLTFKIQLNFAIIKHPIFKEMLVYCAYMGLGVGSGILVNKLDTTMLEGLTKSATPTGIYTIALSMAAIIELPRRPLAKLSSPILAKNLKTNNMINVLNIYQKSALNLFIVSGILFALIWVNIDYIFQLIPNGDLYKSGKYVVLLIGIARIMDLGLGVNSQIISNSKYFKWLLFITPILAICTITFNLIFIPKFNIIGAAIASLLAIFINCVIRAFLVYKKLDIHPFGKNYFKTIPLFILPLLICYFIQIENKWIGLLVNSSIVAITFCLPVYLMKLSLDLNNLIDNGFKKIRSFLP